MRVTTISTMDTIVQLVDTDSSRNKAVHAAPKRNGLPITVTEEWDARITEGVTLMMIGSPASRSDTA